MQNYNYIFEIGNEKIPIYKIQSKIYRCQIRVCQPTEAMDLILLAKESEDNRGIEIVCAELGGMIVKHKVKKETDFIAQIPLNDSININGEAFLFCQNSKNGQIAINAMFDSGIEIQEKYNMGESFYIWKNDQIILSDGSILTCQMNGWDSWDNEDW